MISVVEGMFWSKVNKKGPIHPIHGQCWVWTGSRFSQGYGRLIGHGRAHRISWEIHFGDIPDGLCVCHHCDNPSCVNPKHLFLGTKGDNIRDRNAKGRDRTPQGDDHWSRISPEKVARGDRNGSRTHPEKMTRGEKYWSAKLTEDEVRLIREFHKLGCQVLARTFGVSPNTISRIVRRKQWKHV